MNSFSLILIALLGLLTLKIEARRYPSEHINRILTEVIEEFYGDEDMSTSCTVNASSLNVRRTGSMTGAVIRSVPRGTSCTRYSTNNSGWSQVSCGGVSGWVSSSYLSCSGGSTGGGYIPMPVPRPNPFPTPTPTPTPSPSFPPSGGCSLTRYSGAGVSGSAVINRDWRSQMDRLASYARGCGVTIHITSSFRTSSNVSGAIVTPASRSNHMIGEAIDFNLNSSEGFCNSSCLSGWKSGRIGSKAKCFLDRVNSDRSFRLGLNFSTPDPVHIDSGRNVSNPSSWDRTYQQTQSDHRRGCY